MPSMAIHDGNSALSMPPSSCAVHRPPAHLIVCCSLSAERKSQTPARVASAAAAAPATATPAVRVVCFACASACLRGRHVIVAARSRVACRFEWWRALHCVAWARESAGGVTVWGAAMM